MIVVSDTSPINYLLLIDQIDLFPRLFGQIIIPDVVRGEMLDADAPAILQQWIVKKLNEPSVRSQLTPKKSKIPLQNLVTLITNN
ncbi:hypothetical protein [Microcystis sp. LSC13-02]|jgi:predicted nucleic acid-binding protein|uniref:hypothetical protein n=1 Tax=Microcystis sp. LSC13-02 TaxID=1895004 RepID=UPI00257F6C6A|nr:hypothetical protein [Microcystis sp. LSC13-02]